MALAEQLKTVKPFAARTDFTDYVPRHGLSVNFILSYLAGIDGVDSMRDVEAFTIKVTERFHCSFTELLLQHEKFDKCVVDQAEYFVSFAYDTNLETLVDALDRFRKKKEKADVFVWISIFSVNQHFQAKEGKVAPIQYPKTWFKNAFETCIASIKNVLFILTPIRNPIALHRLWCIYELYLSVSIDGANLDVCLSEEDELTFVNGLLEDTNSILALINAIQAKNAKAHPAQEKKLRERIEDIPGQYGALDNAVRDRLREWFAYTARRFIEVNRVQYKQDMQKYFELLTAVGTLFHDQGHYDEAEALKSEALKESMGYYGTNHVE